MTNCMVGAASPSASQDTKLDITMDREVAKPFRMLSAYFIVTDTINPPKAWNAEELQNSYTIYINKEL